MGYREDLQQVFKRFPGIGTKSAERFVYHLLKLSDNDVDEMITLFKKVRENTKQCPVSRQFFFTNGSDSKLSPIERDPNRDNARLLIVAIDQDILSIESSGIYNGKYFVLGKYLDLTKTKLSDDIVKNIRSTISHKLPDLQEIIFGFAFNKEGEHTQITITHAIADLINKNKIKISTLGRGLSRGSELEYADPQTIKYALEHRS